MNNIITAIKNIKDRPNWDEYFILIAYLISKRSTCSKLNVGCIIVNNNRIISTGYNGHIPNGSHSLSIKRDNHEMATIHAETNAICDASKRGVALENATAYLTHFPCINCGKSLIASGIKTIIYAEDYNNDEIIIQLLNEANIQIKKLII